jgi:iron complex outermembrane recepter protein
LISAGVGFAHSMKNTSTLSILAISVHLALAGDVAAQTAIESAPKRKDEVAVPTKTEALEVVGRRQSGSYHADETSGAKVDLPLRELPQAVRVMSRQTLDDLGATRLDDVLDYAGGVSRQNHFGGLWDNIAIRGFAGDINNGMPLLRNGFSANRGFNAPRDTANVERIEFLKGPVASLYGSTEPGGTINVVTKKPLWQFANAVEAYLGSFKSKRVALDSTGPIVQSVAYRLNIAYEDKDSFRDFITTKRELVAPALTWRIAGGTALSYDAEWLRHRTPLDRGVVATNGRLGDVSRERFTGEPADGTVEVENSTHQLALDHEFNDTWRARAALGFKQGSLYGFSTEPAAALQADERTLRRQRRFRDYESDDVPLQLNCVATSCLVISRMSCCWALRATASRSTSSCCASILVPQHRMPLMCSILFMVKSSQYSRQTPARLSVSVTMHGRCKRRSPPTHNGV